MHLGHPRCVQVAGVIPNTKDPISVRYSVFHVRSLTMLMPKRVKFRKQMRGRMKGKETRGVQVSFGKFGLQALEPCWMTQRQIEAARRAVVRYCKRRGKLWVRIFPDKPVTKKPAETRMGSGKGAPDRWVSVVKRGRVMFEVGGVKEEVAKEAFRLASHKLPIPTSIIVKPESERGAIIEARPEPVAVAPEQGE